MLPSASLLKQANKLSFIPAALQDDTKSVKLLEFFIRPIIQRMQFLIHWTRSVFGCLFSLALLLSFLWWHLSLRSSQHDHSNASTAG